MLPLIELSRIERLLEILVCKESVLAGASAYVVWRALYAVFLSPYRKIPGPLLGKMFKSHETIRAFMGKQSEDAEANYHKYGDIYQVGPRHVSVSDPEECRRILATHRFRKTKFYDAFSIVDENLVSTRDPHLNHTHRKLVGPAFTHRSLAQMEPTIAECSIVAIKRKWDSAIERGSGVGEVVYATHFMLAAFDVIGALLFGETFRALPNGDYRAVRWVSNSMKLCAVKYVRKLSGVYPFSIAMRSWVHDKAQFVQYSRDCVTKRRIALADKACTDRPRDILQSMMDAEDPESRIRLTPDQIVAENVAMMVAGTDTTSMTMVWVVHFLMLYPEAYRRLVAEVRSQFAPDHMVGYSEARARLPYLEAVLYEALRLRGVTAANFPRKVPADGATIKGHYLPPGTIVSVNVAGVNHNKALWEQPHRFMPERFLENEKARQSVLTFSSGVRICPGRNLAWVEMFVVLANLIKDYDMALPKDAKYGPHRLCPHGVPEPAPRRHLVTSMPAVPERDCRLVITHAGLARPPCYQQLSHV